MSPKIKRIFALFCVFTAVFSLFSFAGCKQKSASVTGTGTEDDPWKYGEVSIYIVNDNQLCVDGSGEIPDFDTPEDRPWNDDAEILESISIFGEITSIGKNAFKGAGAQNEYFDIFWDNVENIGESAFEGVNFTDACIFTFPESVKTIGKRAFADSTLKEIHFDGVPEKIADDAFAGVSADVFIKSCREWNDKNKSDYGGTLTYKQLFSFECEYIYEGGEMTGRATTYYPENETVKINGSSMDEGYVFSKWEIVEGSLKIDDVKKASFETVFTGNVKAKVYYAKETPETTENAE